MINSNLFLLIKMVTRGKLKYCARSCSCPESCTNMNNSAKKILFSFIQKSKVNKKVNKRKIIRLKIRNIGIPNDRMLSGRAII